MGEKKLTDEEIVKALDVCYNSPCCNADCPYFNKNGRNLCLENKAFYRDMKRIAEEYVRQKAEIERLTEEKKSDAMLLYASGLACEQVKAKNVELQKQVDELKAENDRYAELFGMVGKEFFTVEVGEGEKVKTGVKAMLQQAVKDTAKEILQGLIDKAYVNECIDLTVAEVKAWFREDYGVEVE